MCSAIAQAKAQAIQCACAAADFVEDHQAAIRGVVENVGGLGHLYHESRLAGVNLIAGANAGEETVGYAYCGALGGDVAADLGEERNEREPGECRCFCRPCWGQ